jgi:hypothetical protein
MSTEVKQLQLLAVPASVALMERQLMTLLESDAVYSVSLGDEKKGRGCLENLQSVLFAYSKAQ